MHRLWIIWCKTYKVITYSNVTDGYDKLIENRGSLSFIVLGITLRVYDKMNNEQIPFP